MPRQQPLRLTTAQLLRSSALRYPLNPGGRDRDHRHTRRAAQLSAERLAPAAAAPLLLRCCRRRHRRLIALLPSTRGRSLVSREHTARHVGQGEG